MTTPTIHTATPAGHTVRYIHVDTTALQNGNVVWAHGVLFELSNRRPAFKGEPESTAWAFDTTVVLDLDPERHQIPAHWLGDWTIQGNHRATWAQVLAWDVDAR